MISAKVLILIGGHLATDPRAQKEARALRAAGASVHVRGTWWDPALADEDLSIAKESDIDFAAVSDVRPRAPGRMRLRMRQRFARECFSRFGLLTPPVFGLGAKELLREARRIDADLTMVHSEAGLWVGRELIGEGRRVGVDFEDWFSQDLPPERRKGRPVAALQQLERYLLRHAHCCVTTTRVLAEALARDAGTSRVPRAVPNCFPTGERERAKRAARDPKPVGSVAFHWFSQTIGPDRGLELLAAALPMLKGEWHVVLRGNVRGHEHWFKRAFQDSPPERVHLLERVPNNELLARTMSYDAGLALEQPYCPSKDLTASNKIYEYMRAGLAVIATRTRGQEEVMQKAPGAGVMIPPDDPSALAAAMQRMIDDRRSLQSHQRAAVSAAETTWSWERHAITLIEAVSAGLAATAA